MQKFVITSGNFTENGNFSGYDMINTRLHIHKRQMEAAGWNKIEDVKFPFFAVGAVKQIGQLDENGEAKLNADGSPVLIDRLTATSVFATEEAIVAAHVANQSLDIKISAALHAVAKSSGLSEKAVAALSAASI
jgi:hypothetical protein